MSENILDKNIGRYIRKKINMNIKKIFFKKKLENIPEKYQIKISEDMPEKDLRRYVRKAY